MSAPDDFYQYIDSHVDHFIGRLAEAVAIPRPAQSTLTLKVFIDR